MIELGKLEDNYAEFEKRHARIVVISLDDEETSKKTQDKFPDLIVVADPTAKLVKAVNGIDPHAGHGGGDAAAPTTMILDREAKVRWVYRPPSFLARPAPGEVLAALDKELGD